jgi:hypothetical protein
MGGSATLVTFDQRGPFGKTGIAARPAEISCQQVDLAGMPDVLSS